MRYSDACGLPRLSRSNEYLKTTYRPDRDYIDGEVRERNLGERPHSLLQLLIGSILLAHKDDWKILP